MEPHHFAIIFATSNAVVATVPQRFRFGTNRRHEATGDEFAIRLGPTHSEVVDAKILLRRKRIRLHAVTEMFINMRAQDGFTQTTRTAVNEHDELLLAKTKQLERVCIKNLFDRLQLGEMVTPADRAQRRIKLRGFELLFSEEAADALVPRMFEVEAPCGPAVELGVAADKIRLE